MSKELTHNKQPFKAKEPQKAATKTKRFEARIGLEALDTIRVASQLTGRSVSDFIAAAAFEMAQKTIETQRVITLSVEDQIKFAESLLQPSPALPAALERAKEAHKRLIRNSTNE